MSWFYRVSHPLIVGPAPVPKYVVPRPVYQEIVVEQEWARHPPNPFQVIDDIRGKVEHAMEIPEVVSNPLFCSILDGLRCDYTAFDQVLVSRRRSKSPREHQQQSLIL